MIYITVGTQKFQFNRLFKELDRLVRENVIQEEIIAQRGYSNYVPKSFKSFQLVNGEEMIKYIDDSSLIISHAGTSSIIQCLKLRKKVVVVPRKKEYGEHVDDHQLEIAELFETKNLVEVVYDIEDLSLKLKNAKEKQYSSYEFNNEKLLSSIDEYLEEIKLGI